MRIDLSALYQPNEKQKLFHAATETYKLYGGALGGGKTAALINEGLALSFDYPGNFGLLLRKTAPSFRNTVLPQLKRFLLDLPELIESWNQTAKLITLINRSKILYGGLGDDPTDWQKFMSGEYGWVAVDQVEEFTEYEFQMLGTRLRLQLPGIRRFFLMTCNPSIGWLKRRFLDTRQPDHIFIPALPTDNAGHLPAEYVEKMEALLGPNERKALLHGDWEAIGDPDNVYPYEWVKAAMKRTPSPEDRRPITVGVDVARQGDDMTVVVQRRGGAIVKKQNYLGQDTMKTAADALEAARDLIKYERQYTPRPMKIPMSINVDVVGVGGGPVDRLRQLVPRVEEELLAKIRVIEINGAERARQPTRFVNRRAELHWRLRELLEIGAVSLPDDDELLMQLMSMRYRHNSKNQLEIHPKDEIKERLGRSPDDAEAVIYAFGADAEPSSAGFRVLEHDVMPT